MQEGKQNERLKKVAVRVGWTETTLYLKDREGVRKRGGERRGERVAHAIISRIFIIISSLNETVVFSAGQPAAQAQVHEYVPHVAIALCTKKCCKITIATPKRAIASILTPH